MRILFVCLISLSSAVALSQENETTKKDPFDRRTFRLGMTVTEFKQTAHPDPDGLPGVHAVVSTDAKVQESFDFIELRLHTEMTSMGVVRGKFYYKSSLPREKWEPAGVNLADWHSDTLFYFIADPEGTEPRLFLITSDLPTRVFDELLAIYSQAFSVKPIIEKNIVKNGLGNEFTNTKASWTDGNRVVSLSRYADSLDRAKVEHIYMPLMDVLVKRVEANTKDKANKL